MKARIRVQIARWLGEFFREAALLIAVLGPMELAVQNGFLTIMPMISSVLFVLDATDRRSRGRQMRLPFDKRDNAR